MTATTSTALIERLKAEGSVMWSNAIACGYSGCVESMGNLGDLLREAAAALAAQDATLAAVRAEAASIYRGFENESLNGVVCSIPDAGLDTPTHRTWCLRCQKRWQRLKSLGEAALATEATAKLKHACATVPCPRCDPDEWEEAAGGAASPRSAAQEAPRDGAVKGEELFIDEISDLGSSPLTPTGRNYVRTILRAFAAHVKRQDAAQPCDCVKCRREQPQPLIGKDLRWCSLHGTSDACWCHS